MGGEARAGRRLDTIRFRTPRTRKVSDGNWAEASERIVGKRGRVRAVVSFQTILRAARAPAIARPPFFDLSFRIA